MARGNNKKRYSLSREPIIVYGRNACRSAVFSGEADRLYYSLRLPENDEVVKKARELGIWSRAVDDAQLARYSGHGVHQGLVCQVPPKEETSLRELIELSKKSQYPTIVILDGIEDPHNVGAILRCCDAFGVDGTILRRHGQAPVNSTTYRTSAGAASYAKICEVTSLAGAIRELKDNGFWIVSSEGGATASYLDVDYKMPVALVVGSEGKGISRLVLENSDFVVKIPMHGHVNSLNASVAAGIFLAQIDASRSK